MATNNRTQSIVDLPGEVWKDVVGHEGKYKISNQGRVKSLTRIRIAGRGGAQRLPEIIRVQNTLPLGGYKFLALHDGKRSKSHRVHRLVLEAFIGPCPKGMECRHLDGNGSNNRLENLKWGTIEENWEDKRRHGTAPIGEKTGTAD